MANFWDDLGNTLTRKAKGLSSRAENLYEIQKIRNKLSAQERMTEKLMMDIGKLIYTRYEHGEAVDGEVGAICEEISQHMLEVITSGMPLQPAKVKNSARPAIRQLCGKQVSALTVEPRVLLQSWKKKPQT